MKKLYSPVFLFLAFFTANISRAQTDLCGAAPPLAVNAACINTAYNVNGAWGTEVAAPSCHGVTRDGWFSFVATSNATTITATTNANLGLSVYTACGGAQVACVNAGGAGVGETVTFQTTPGSLYYIRVTRINGGGANMTGNICVVDATITTCASVFTDSGGAGGNYANNENRVTTYCPSVAGQCITASFTSFNTEAEYDFLYVYDGPTINSTQMQVLHNTTLPNAITATTANTTGCLTFRFRSDGTTVRAGWSANISCAACATPAAPGSSSEDCGGAPTVCNSNSFAGNSSGAGATADLNAGNQGCLGGENQSSWYYFSPSSNGTLEFIISPSNGTDDYDFALWGPMVTVTCPPATAPIRCSYAAGGGNTGSYNASGDNSENAFGDRWINHVNVLAGEIYVLLVDNFAVSGSPFTLSWTLSGGASLDCTPLPIELLEFRGNSLETKNVLQWATLSEKDNDFFTIEKSADGEHFYDIAVIDGAMNSTTLLEYEYFDELPLPGTNYYRLRQTDIDGRTTTSKTIAVEFKPQAIYAGAAYPNPSSDNFMLEIFSEENEKVMIEVVDVTGKKVSSEQISIAEGINKHVLKTEVLEKGVYFVNVKDKSGKLISAQALMKN